MSGGRRTATERQRARTRRLAAAGLKRVVVIVPTECVAEIQRMARSLRESTRPG